jgi:D-tyrosyl-tRNA(Tyr) deacylase
VRAVVQRVENASVKVDEKVVGAIDRGLLVYVGVGKDDAEADAEWLAEKIVTLRIFPDAAYKMNLSVQDEQAGILVVSQFTLFADARKGRRPSYDNAAAPDVARSLYERFVEKLRGHDLNIETGEYQAVMDVAYINKGPITILLDTKKSF